MTASQLYAETDASIYDPLDSSRQEIRTITVALGRLGEDVVTCKLNIVSLLDNPAFEALSYSWGPPRPTCRIFINGQRLAVGQNVESALAHLRYKDRPRTLWVDALCINQDDISERNSQVQLMGTIYSRTSGVLAWLGPEYYDSDLAFDFFEMMHTDPESHWDPERYPEIKAVYTAPHVVAVNKLLERSWWHRVWTLQESILCPVLTFVCGPHQLPAEQAFKVATCWFKHMYSCCQDTWYMIFNSTAEQPGLGDICTALGTIEEMRESTEKYQFEQILSKFMVRQCSDPHDKIYGLLGIASKKETARIIPEYNKPVAQVYQEVALSLIQQKGNLDILSMRYPKPPNHVGSVVEGLPSWVPDWTLDSDSTFLYDVDDRFCALPYYSASQDSWCHATSTSSGSLSVRGRFIGRIATLSSDEDHMEAPSLKDFFLEWRKMIAIDQDPDRPYAKSPCTTVKDAFWQTLCCSLIPDLTGPRKNNLLYKTTDDSPYKHLFDAWWEWCEKYDCNPHKLIDIQSEEYSRAEINVMGGVVSTSISMRRLFISEGDGWIGLVPSDAIVGDRVVLLEGGRVPYILRPVANEDGSAVLASYRFIGAAYVHGVMDGSEWKDDEIEELSLL
ncbi:heterokaryon incompatibility protein-domain-containing protein [Xylaria digitata]|nr:heterokaryon incompatibility protein-domain-containing protein [Xylaria digitata]